MLFAVNVTWISMASFAWKDSQAAYLNSCAPVFQVVAESFDPFLKLYVWLCTYLNENEISVILFSDACMCASFQNVVESALDEILHLLPESLNDSQAQHYSSQSFIITELTHSSLHEKKKKTWTNKWKALFISTTFLYVLPFPSYAQTPFTDIFLSPQFYFALYIYTIAVNGVICSCNPLVPS